MLNLVRYKDFLQWDVKRYSAVLFKSKYPIVELRKHIQEENHKVKPFNFPEDDFKILGVSNKVGLFDNEILKGSQINQSYKKVENGYLAYNPYRINVGSIGLKTDEHTYDYISPAYVVFSCKDDLMPEYLFLLFKTKTFNGVVRETTRGSVRQILAYDLLETMKIPLPPLDVQRQIVEDYHSKLDLSKQQQKEVVSSKQNIEKHLFEELGIELTKKENADQNNIFQITSFRELSRWDVVFLLNQNSISSKYEFKPINDILNAFMQDENGGSLRFDTQKFPNDDFKYIGMENVEKGNGKLLEVQNVIGTDIKSQTIKLPRNFFIYGKLRPYLNKYLFNDIIDGDNTIVSSEFFVFSVKNINTDYFRIILGSSVVQYQIENLMKGARMPRIGEDTFKSLKIPVPDIDVQNEIANHINGIEKHIELLNQQAEENKFAALREFEEDVFDIE